MIQIAGHNRNSNLRTLVLATAFTLFCSFPIFAQSTDKQSDTGSDASNKSIVKQESTSAPSNLNFVLWFMGTKQDPTKSSSTENMNTKKQIMTSGLAPNRLLIKAFLKKTINLESTVA